MNEQEWIKKLEDEGFVEIEVAEFESTKDLGWHTHDEHTVHIMLQGELHITEENGETHVYKAGDRVDFPAGTYHGARFGDEGCKFIVGFKK